MRLYQNSTRVLLIVGVVSAGCLWAQAPATPASEAKGMPPRASPGEYQAQVQVGAFTLAGEFTGHAVPTADGDPLSTDDYIVVEVAFFGPPEARIKLSLDDFSLRINTKKAPLPSEPSEVVFKSLKDPQWAPPKTESKSKTSIGGGGGGQTEGNSPPPVVHIPIELRRSMQQRVQKVSLLLGDRALPQAGLVFFSYHGKTDGLSSVDLIYNGPAGKATLALQR